MCAKKAAAFAAESPGHIARFRFDTVKINSIREKDGEPGLARLRFLPGLVSLNFNCSRADADLVELPAPQQNSPRIKGRANTMRIDRPQSFLSLLCLEP